MQDLNEQIEDLQTRVAFQDHTLQQLNDVIAKQQRELEKLSRAMLSLSQQFSSWRDEQGQGGGHEPPPHY